MPCLTIPNISNILDGLLAFIILFLLLIILILMFWRWRQHKHPVPERFRTMVTVFQNRSAAPHVTDNELYSSDVVYEKRNNNVKLSPKNERKLTVLPPHKNNLDVITNKNLQMGNATLGEGRFAIVRKAVLLRGNQNIAVAVKALRSGYSKDDENIMKQKIKFMSKIPNHVNLVNYIATYEDEMNNSGPAMLLDCCEQPLPDWLNSIKHVTPDVLDNMLTYSLNIARGMEHLHNNNVLHRRLSAKNVLLVKTVNGTIAKLIGYGPTKDDQPSSGEQPLLKIKYLAPETLSSMKAVHPVYDEKTDAWSYGVTMWEIYSKGDAPYANVKSGDMVKHLKNDNKLPCPKDCAKELYDSTMLPCWNLKSNQRPRFTQICRSLEKFRNGADGKGQGYYGPDDVAEQQEKPRGYYSPDDVDDEYGSKDVKNIHGEDDENVYDDTNN